MLFSHRNHVNLSEPNIADFFRLVSRVKSGESCMLVRTMFFGAVVAIILGVTSPYVIVPTPDVSRLVYAWLYWPWLEPDTAFMALNIAVFTIHYLTVLALAWAIGRLARTLRDFMRPISTAADCCCARGPDGGRSALSCDAAVIFVPWHIYVYRSAQ